LLWNGTCTSCPGRCFYYGCFMGDALSMNQRIFFDYGQSALTAILSARAAAATVRRFRYRISASCQRVRYRLLKLPYISTRAGVSLEEGCELIESLGSNAPWVFHDEEWIHVKNRWHYRHMLA